MGKNFYENMKTLPETLPVMIDDYIEWQGEVNETPECHKGSNYQ